MALFGRKKRDNSDAAPAGRKPAARGRRPVPDEDVAPLHDELEDELDPTPDGDDEPAGLIFDEDDDDQSVESLLGLDGDEDDGDYNRLEDFQREVNEPVDDEVDIRSQELEALDPAEALKMFADMGRSSDPPESSASASQSVLDADGNVGNFEIEPEEESRNLRTVQPEPEEPEDDVDDLLFDLLGESHESPMAEPADEPDASSDETAEPLDFDELLPPDMLDAAGAADRDLPSLHQTEKLDFDLGELPEPDMSGGSDDDDLPSVGAVDLPELGETGGHDTELNLPNFAELPNPETIVPVEPADDFVAEDEDDPFAEPESSEDYADPVSISDFADIVDPEPASPYTDALAFAADVDSSVGEASDDDGVEAERIESAVDLFAPIEAEPVSEEEARHHTRQLGLSDLQAALAPSTVDYDDAAVAEALTVDELEELTGFSGVAPVAANRQTGVTPRDPLEDPMFTDANDPALWGPTLKLPPPPAGMLPTESPAGFEPVPAYGDPAFEDTATDATGLVFDMVSPDTVDAAATGLPDSTDLPIESPFTTPSGFADSYDDAVVEEDYTDATGFLDQMSDAQGQSQSADSITDSGVRRMETAELTSYTPPAEPADDTEAAADDADAEKLVDTEDKQYVVRKSRKVSRDQLPPDAEPPPEWLGGLLFAEGVITAECLDEFRDTVEAGDRDLLDALRQAGTVRRAELQEFLAQLYEIPQVQLERLEPQAAAVESVPEKLGRDLKAVPVRRFGDMLVVAVADASQAAGAVRELRCETGLRIKLVTAVNAESIASALDKVWPPRPFGAPPRVAPVSAAAPAPAAAATVEEVAPEAEPDELEAALAQIGSMVGEQPASTDDDDEVSQPVDDLLMIDDDDEGTFVPDMPVMDAGDMDDIDHVGDLGEIDEAVDPQGETGDVPVPGDSPAAILGGLLADSPAPPRIETPAARPGPPRVQPRVGKPAPPGVSEGISALPGPPPVTPPGTVPPPAARKGVTGRRRAADLENEPLTAPVTNRPPVKPAAVSDVNLATFKMPGETAPTPPAAAPAPRRVVQPPPVAAPPPVAPQAEEAPKVKARKGTTRRQARPSDTPLVSDVNLQVFRMPDEALSQEPPEVPDARPVALPPRNRGNVPTSPGSPASPASPPARGGNLPRVDTTQRDRAMQSMPKTRKPIGPDRKRKLPTALTTNVTGKLPNEPPVDDSMDDDDYAGSETLAFISPEEMAAFAEEEERRRGASGKHRAASDADDNAPRAQPFSFDDDSGEQHEGEYDDF